jgi:hypothetical protein
VRAHDVKREPAAHARRKGEVMATPKPTSDLERVFDSFLNLTSDEQKEFRAMLRGRDWAAPPAQLPLKPAAAPSRSRSHKKPAPPVAATPMADRLDEIAEAKSA